MVLIPEGVLHPSHSAVGQPFPTVRLAQFLIDREPVTARRFRRFLEQGGYEEPVWWTPAGWRQRTSGGTRSPAFRRDGHRGDDDDPITGVSWWEALAYARFVGKSLPTEAQWEYTCRGLDGPGLPVSGCQVLFVAEWCLDTFQPGSRGGADLRDPLHFTDEADAHVVLGRPGSDSPEGLGDSGRGRYLPWWRDNRIGFRCAAPVSARCLCHPEAPPHPGTPSAPLSRRS